MKTLTAGFETEKNKTTGAAPVWILKIPFSAGTMYLSDRALPTGLFRSGDGAWWSADGSVWTQINPTTPAALVSIGAKAYAIFTGFGVYEWDGETWTNIIAADPDSIMVSGGVLYGDFGAFGPYSYDGTPGLWTSVGAMPASADFFSLQQPFPWIADWGSIDQDISDEMASPQVSDFSVDVIIDPAAASSIADLLASEDVESLRCELFLWFEDLDAATDPPIPLWVGNIIDPDQRDELIYHLQLVDESVRQDKHPGRVLSLADYPNAALNDVGYQMPIGYGALERVPALRLDVPRNTSLMESINQWAKSFELTDAVVSAGDVIVIDDEEILVKAVSGKTVSDSARGFNEPGYGTFVAQGRDIRNWNAMCTAPNGDVYVAVRQGDIYVQTGGVGPFVGIGETARDWYALCAAPNGDIYAAVPNGDIYIRAGGSGAFTALTAGAVSWQSLCAAPNGDVYAVAAGTDIYIRAGGAGSFTALSQGAYAWLGICADSNGDVYCARSPGDIYKRTAGAGNFIATGQTARTWIVMTAMPNNDLYASVSGGDVYKRAAGGSTFVATGQVPRVWRSLSPSNGNLLGAVYGGDIYTLMNTKIASHTTGSMVRIKEAEGTLLFLDHPTGPITKVESVDENGVCTDVTDLCTLYTGQTGDELAGYEGMGVFTTQVSYLVGDRFLVSGQGYQDDGSGTITGTPNALIERPDHIAKHFLYTYLAWPLADFVTDADTPFAADSYAMAVLIRERKRIKEWMAKLAFECRCWFYFAEGKANLIYRPTSLASEKTLTASQIIMNDDYVTSVVGPGRSPLYEVINKIDLLYKRNWSVDLSQVARDSYQAVESVSDATSIARYGEKEKPDLFCFDFVRDATMAGDVAAFYLARYKDRKKKFSAAVLLDQCEIEFGDGVTLAPRGNVLCEVRKVNSAPGTSKRIDRIELWLREF